MFGLQRGSFCPGRRSPATGVFGGCAVAAVLLATLALTSCSSSPDSEDSGEPSTPAAADNTAFFRELDRQKSATRRRMDGEPEPVAPSSPATTAGAAGTSADSGSPQGAEPETPVLPEPATPSPEEIAPRSPPPEALSPRREAATADTATAGTADTATADTGPTPDWCTTRKHPSYSPSQYLVGFGLATAKRSSGGNRDVAASEAYQQARTLAVADILAQFETHVVSEVKTFIQQTLQIRNEEEESRIFHAGSSRVKAVVEGSLKGIEPAEYHYDAENRTACVVVAIRRLEYARQVAAEIAALDEKIRGRVEEARQLEQKGDAFRAHKIYREVESLLVGRRSLKARILYAVPGYDLPESAPPLSLVEVYAARRRLVPQLQLVLAVQHEAFGRPANTTRIEEQLVSSLKEFGFRVKLAPGKLQGRPAEELLENPASVRGALGQTDAQDLLLVSKLTSEGRTIEAGLYRVRTEGWARLLDVQEEELLITASTPAGNQNKAAVGILEKQSELLEKSASSAAALLAREIYQKFEEFETDSP